MLFNLLLRYRSREKRNMNFVIKKKKKKLVIVQIEITPSLSIIYQAAYFFQKQRELIVKVDPPFDKHRRPFSRIVPLESLRHAES